MILARIVSESLKHNDDQVGHVQEYVHDRTGWDLLKIDPHQFESTWINADAEEQETETNTFYNLRDRWDEFGYAANGKHEPGAEDDTRRDYAFANAQPLHNQQTTLHDKMLYTYISL